MADGCPFAGKSKKVLDTTKMSSNEIFQAILKADGQL
jgi:hypothetical protein